MYSLTVINFTKKYTYNKHTKYLESGENVPLDLGDTGQHIGGGDLTKRA